jgi:hypothetical protein
MSEGFSEEKYFYLLDYMVGAVRKNYLLIVLVSSSASDKIRDNVNMDFGVSKTALSLKLCHLVYRGILDYNYDKAWDLVFENLVYSIEEFMSLIKRAFERNERIPCVVWDDAQLSLGVDRSHDPKITRLANLITTLRPILSILILNAPHMSSLCVQLRRLINFNVIVPFRGYYKVQFLRKSLDFNNPYKMLINYEYRGESPFLPLPKDVEKRYLAWRMSHSEKLVKERGERARKGKEKRS